MLSCFVGEFETRGPMMLKHLGSNSVSHDAALMLFIGQSSHIKKTLVTLKLGGVCQMSEIFIYGYICCFRNKKAILKDESRLVKQSTKPVMPRTSRARGKDRSTTKLRDQMEKLGEHSTLLTNDTSYFDLLCILIHFADKSSNQ